MQWSDLPSDPKAALTALAMMAITTFLVPAGRAKLEELRAKAKTAALWLAMEYAREAVRWVANERRRLGIDGEEAEKLALQHVKALAAGVPVLKKWTQSDWASALRRAYEEFRDYERQWNRDIERLNKQAQAGLERLDRAAAAADALNATRAPEETDGGS